MTQLDFKTVVKQEEERLREVYPTADDIPGCLSLFELWTGCNALRSQVKAIYRYGGRPQCSEKADDFKFCLSLKALHPEEQREAWIKRRAEWWAHRRLNKSSEDVWDIREKPVEGYPPPLDLERLAAEFGEVKQ
ncbi:DNA replication licensing factor cdc19 [Coprinopsis cinerea AmutBmut pab1-1]|nr:DNA replication licensing factor cdc19 [Coprinopsis cinerea AmutBmut pab1-1]